MSATLAFAAAWFSALTSAQISPRKIGTSDGASMPSLTVDPAISSTVMVTSSPRQICSPDLRVITSIGGRVPRLSTCRRYGHSRVARLHLFQLHLGEEGM